MWFNDQYRKAYDLLAQIEKGVPYSQVFEFLERLLYGEVLYACRPLDAFDTNLS